MRAVLLVFAVLLCGCLGGSRDYPATTTLPAYVPTLEDAGKAAEEDIMRSTAFTSAACRNLRLTNQTKLPCSGCWRLTYSYVCGESGSNKTELHGVVLTIENGNVSGYVESPAVQACVLDWDCAPERPIAGIRYACEGGVCLQRTFDDPPSKYCAEKGLKLVVRRQPNRETYAACLFPNGNECEVGSYYLNRCGPDTGNLSDCTGYSQIQICSTEYKPTCAKVNANISGSETYVWKSYNNPCTACLTRSMTESTVGYRLGYCPPTTTTTLPSGRMENAAQEYCGRMGYVYLVRRYSSGQEYGVCVFGIENECNAEDYFHGRCEPKRILG